MSDTTKSLKHIALSDLEASIADVVQNLLGGLETECRIHRFSHEQDGSVLDDVFRLELDLKFQSEWIRKGPAKKDKNDDDDRSDNIFEDIIN